MNPAEKFIRQKLYERQQNGTYRQLSTTAGLIDFCSNDYLGFARSSVLKGRIAAEIAINEDYLNGSTGSRLLAGNTSYAEELEQQLSAFFNSPAGLIFNSGYDANLGLFSSLPQKGDTIIMDELVHASIIDGARLSFANRYNFKHNDLASLEEKLRNAKGISYVVIESVYSMDGDTPPIPKILELTEKYNAQLIVDEAHAAGLYGKGLINQLGLEEGVFARLVTFGKALGCHGAIILGNKLLREYLVNFSRSFIYTTAASFHQLAAIKMACKLLPEASENIQQLENNILYFKKKIAENKIGGLIPSNSAIQCLVIGGNERTRQVARYLQGSGLDVRPILSPTVPAGTERLRICLHSFNTINEITLLADNINQYLNADTE